MNIEYALATVSRPEGYVHDTIKSLEETGFFDRGAERRLRLVVGSPESAYLDRYRLALDRFSIEEMTEFQAEQIRWKNLWGTQRCALTHSLCLGRAGSLGPIDALLYMQDDISFSKGWIERLKVVSEDLVSKLGWSWILTLYTPRSKEPLERYRNGEKWYRRQIEPTTAFYGCQAVLYPAKVLAPFSEYLMKNNVLNYVKPDDHLLPDFAKANGLPIVSTTPCLVQHMGSKSFGVCNVFHQSESFLPTLS